MPETCTDIYDDKSKLLHQVGTSRHFRIIYLNIQSVPRSKHTPSRLHKPVSKCCIGK